MERFQNPKKCTSGIEFDIAAFIGGLLKIYHYNESLEVSLVGFWGSESCQVSWCWVGIPCLCYSLMLPRCAFGISYTSNIHCCFSSPPRLPHPLLPVSLGRSLALQALLLAWKPIGFQEFRKSGQFWKCSQDVTHLVLCPAQGSVPAWLSAHPEGLRMMWRAEVGRQNCSFHWGNAHQGKRKRCLIEIDTEFLSQQEEYNNLTIIKYSI